MTTTRIINNTAAPLVSPDGTPIPGVSIIFTLVDSLGNATTAFDSTTGERVVDKKIVYTDISGIFTVALWPNDRGDVATSYKCEVNLPNVPAFTAALASGATPISWIDFRYAGIIPAAAQISTIEYRVNKEASGGYAGLTLFKLNLRNAANTITSWFTTAATVARTWTMPDKDGTVAMTSDITGINSGTNTGDQDLSGKQNLLTNSAGLAAALGDETGTGLAVFNNAPSFTGVAEFVDGFLTRASSVICSGTPGNKILTLGSNPTANDASSFRLVPSTTAINWAIQTNWNVGGALEITPSTVGGGDTFSTPALVIGSTNNLGLGQSPDASFKLALSGSSAAIVPGILFNDTVATPSNYAAYINGAKNFVIRDMSVAADRISIAPVTGNVTIGAAGTTLYADGTIKTGDFIVSTLPAGTTGSRAYVTDATAPTFLGALTGGGAVVCPVIKNATAWIAG